MTLNNISVEVYFQNDRKSLPKLPPTFEALCRALEELFNSKLSGAYTIEFVRNLNGIRKFMDPETYLDLIKTKPTEGKIEFFIEEQPEDLVDRFKDQSSLGPIYESQIIYVKPNQNKNLENLLQDISSIEDEGEESKNGESKSFIESGAKTDNVEIKDETPGGERSDIMNNKSEHFVGEVHKSHLHAREVIKDNQEEEQKINGDVSELIKEYERGLEENDMNNYEDLVKGIETKQKEYDGYVAGGKKNNAAAALAKVQEFQSLQELLKKIESLKKPQDDDDVPKEEDIEELEREVKEGLENNDIETYEELVKEIEAKQKEYEGFVANNRKNNAAAALTKVQELKRLQELFDRIKSLKESQAAPIVNIQNQEEIEELERQVEERLEKYDLSSFEELLTEIEKTKTEHDGYVANKRKNNAAAALTKLQDLNDIHEMFLKIKSLKQPEIEVPNEELENELKERLEKYDLTTFEELLNEIEKTKAEYEGFVANKKKNNAATALAKIAELKNLRDLFAKRKPIKQDKMEPVAAAIGDSIGEQKEIVAPNSDDVEALRLGSLYESYQPMPNCVERSLLVLIYYCSLKLLKGNSHLISSLFRPANLDQELVEEFENLSKRVRIEETYISHLDFKLQKWKTSIESGDFEELKRDFSLMLKELRPMNIQELLKLLKEGEKTANRLENEEVFLLVGGTGCGKSTTIHFFAGSRMGQKGDHIFPIEIRNKAVKDVITSSASKSETRYITAIPVDLHDLDPRYDGKVLLCDTPGFGDTAGAEVDIANAISIYQAVCKCKSVKPVIIISHKGLGDRWQGLKTLAHILVGMIPGIKENDIIRSISYLFTKFPEKKQASLNADIIKLRSELDEQEKADEGFLTLFDDLKRKTRENPIFIDPINGNPAKILESMLLGSSIPYPENVFKFSINEESKGVLLNQAHKNQQMITSAAKRLDYKLVEYKLEELKKLNEALDLESLKKTYAQCVSLLKKHLNEQYKLATAQIEKCLGEGNVLSEAEVEGFRVAIQNAQLADELRDLYLGVSDVVGSEAYTNYLNERIDLMMIGLESRSIDDLSLKATLDKAKLLASEFEDVQVKYKEACEKVSKQIFKVTIENFKDLYAKHEYEESGLVLTKIHKAISSYENHLEKAKMLKEYENLKTEIKNTLINLVAKVEPMFKREELQEKDIEELRVCIERLESVKNSTSLQLHLSQSELTKIYTDLVNLAVKYVQDVVKKIGEILKEKREKSFGQLEILIKEISMVKSIPGLEAKTLEFYYNTLSRIIDYILSLKTEIQNELNKISQENQKVNYQRIYICLGELQSAEWISKYKENVYTDLMQIVREEIIDQFRILKDDLRGIPVNLDHAENVKIASQKVAILKDMRCFESIIPELALQREMVEEAFKDKTDYVFKKIDEMVSRCVELSELSLRAERVKKSIDFLEVCKKIPQLDERASELLNGLEDSLRKCKSNVNEELKTSFIEIEEYILSIQNGTIQASPSNNNNSILAELDGNNEGSSSLDSQEDRMSKKYIHKKIKLISSHLQDLKNICPYEKIFRYFEAKTLSDYEKKIQDMVSEMSQNMQTFIAGGNLVDLNSYIQVAKALSEFDQFFDISAGEKFKSIAKEYHSKLVEETKGKKDNITEKIGAFEFEHVRDYFDDLAVSEDPLFRRQLVALKTLLNYKVQSLLEETLNKARLVRWRDRANAHEKAKEVISKLEKIHKAGETVAKYLEEDCLTKLEKCKKDVTERFSKSLLEYLDDISEQIANCNFSKDITDKKEFAEEMNDLVGKFLDEKVEDKIKSLEKIENETLEGLEQKYVNMKITDYVMYPPKAVLEKLEGKSKVQFGDKKEVIEKQVYDTFEKELEAAQTSLSNEAAQKHLRNVLFALNSLPESLKLTLSKKYDDCKEFVTHRKKEFDDRLLTLKQKPSLSGYVDLIKKCQEMGEKTTLAEIENSVDRDLVQIKKDINNKLSERKILNIKDDIHKMLDYVGQLSSFFEGVNDSWKGVEKTLCDSLKKLSDSFVVKFKYPNVAGDPLALQNVFKDIMSYALLLIKTNEASDGQTQEELLKPLLNDCSEKLKEINLMMKDSFTEIDKEYKDVLSQKKPDMNNLAKCLRRSREWGPLVGLIKGADDSVAREFYEALEAGKELSFQKINGQVQNMLKQLIDKDKDLKFINSQTRGFKNSRDQYYIDLQEKLEVLDEAVKYLSGFEINMESQLKEMIVIIDNQIKELFKKANDNLLKMFTGRMENLREICEEFSLNYSNLVSAETNLRVLKNKNDPHYEIEQSFSGKFSSYICTIEADVYKIENYTNGLKFIKTLSAYIQPFKEKIDAKINEILDVYKTKKGGAQAIAKLGTLLNTDKTGIGQRIIEEHSVFKGYSLSLFNSKTQKHDINYVLDKLEGDGLEKEKLLKRFKEFETHYKDLIQNHLKRNPDLNLIVSNTKLLAENFIQKPDHVVWNHSINVKIPELMAHIFALWTLKNAEHYFEVEDLNDRQNFLLQPHAAQVISIFRILGVGATKEELQNNLVQIGTGEGKSVTLAVTASVLALLGFDVSCACYSQYLCDRDYEAFKSLFELLGLGQNIHYGTFNKLCEDALNQNGEVRKIVESLISKGIKDAVLMNKEFGRARVLLIDEVDVFFSKNFYGELYTPSVNIRDATITQLLDWIWENRNNRLNLALVKASAQYQTSFARFKDYGFLVEEAVKDMLFDLREYPSHQYIVKEDKIGYIDGDSVSFQAVNRYQTVFAYYHEHEKKRISKKSLDDNKWMRIVCGNFSFAEIPKQFSFIMGVTGTLKTLTKPERKVIEGTYNIKKNTYSPSVFGANNFTFNPREDVSIENEHDYHNRIAREVNDKLRGNNGKKRAVLVFFESAAKLEECKASKAFDNLRDRIICLTEEALPNEKDSVIKRAPCSGQVTFLTKTFGRGTDFVVNDQDVSTSGGLHVIQTFVSDELSEEVQIKGRTARQGDYGSYSMILLESSLEKFLVFKEDLVAVKNGTGIFSRIYHAIKGAKVFKSQYELIDERRNENFESQYEEREKAVVEAKKEHDLAVDFMNNIKVQEVKKVNEFLLVNNKGTAEIVRSKTIILMDATGSMTHLLLKAKNTVGIMYERIKEILRDANLPEDLFLMQFACFRNYNSDENLILQNSIWETKSNNIRAFMDKIGPDGGWGNEAVEVGLWHAYSEHQKESISQVILIGDAPANSKDEVTQKRTYLGEDYWAKTKYATKLFCMEEAQKLKNSNVPVHAFYVAEKAKTSFTEITTLTNGRCEFLDVNSPKGADLLTNLVSEVLLNNIGQQNGKGDGLVQAYKKKFIKSYS